MKIFFWVFILMVFAACHSEDPLSKIKKTPMSMRDFEEDLIVPSGLWKVMESIYRPLALDPEGKAVKEGQEGQEAEKEEGKKDRNAESPASELMKKKPPLDPISFHLYMVEKTSGVLGGQNYDLQFPVGGGALDYRYFVPGSKDGTFFLKIKYDQEMEPKDLHVYYLSNAKIRDVGDKPMGNGCNRYFDITDYWKKIMKGEGLELNTANFRHISVTAGTLFFVAPVKGKLRITHLSIKDTRHRDLMCSSEK